LDQVDWSVLDCQMMPERAELPARAGLTERAGTGWKNVDFE
jgi:hypothetical protein